MATTRKPKVPTPTEALEPLQLLIRRIESLEATVIKQHAQLLEALKVKPSSIPVSKAALTVPEETREDKISLLILNALAQVRVAKLRLIPRQWLAVLIGVSEKYSRFNERLGSLAKAQLVVYPARGSVALAPGIPASGPRLPLTLGSFSFNFVNLFDRQQSDILVALVVEPSKWFERGELARITNQSETSSAFRERLAGLRDRGYIEYGGNQTVRITLQWFTPVAESNS